MAGTVSVPESSLPLLSVFTLPEPLLPSQFRLVETPSMEYSSFIPAGMSFFPELRMVKVPSKAPVV